MRRPEAPGYALRRVGAVEPSTSPDAHPETPEEYADRQLSIVRDAWVETGGVFFLGVVVGGAIGYYLRS